MLLHQGNYSKLSSHSADQGTCGSSILAYKLRLTLGYKPLHKSWEAAWFITHGPQQRDVDDVHDANVQDGIDGKQGRDSDFHSQR